MDSANWQGALAGFEQHPLSALFPAMAAAEFAELRADIAKHGLRQPVTIYEGQVLEGWHRTRACAETGTRLTTDEFTGGEREALAFVLSANLHRRHLTTSDRSMIAARLATLRWGERKRSQMTPLSIKQAAEALKVSSGSVTRARKVLARGDPELIARVAANELTVSRASLLVPTPAPQASRSALTLHLQEGDTLVGLKATPYLAAHVCITSPPYYGKFDYEIAGQLGLEESVADYLRPQVAVFREVRRIMVEGGTAFIVIGDTANNFSPVRSRGERKGCDGQWLMRRSLELGYREKETLNVPLRLAEALRQDGWVHRATLIWDKGTSGAVPNSDTAPECHEYILHMIKWTPKKRPYGNTSPLRSSVLHHHAASHPRHGAVFPVSLVEELLAVCPAAPVIVDPYIGSGTVAIAASRIVGAVLHGYDLDCSLVAAAIAEKRE
jgi:site-specific DNA-methyltransferase (cytosine-N4-specific)